MGIPTVNGNEILKDIFEGTEKMVTNWKQKLTGLQTAAFWLTIGVGVTGLIVILALGFTWYRQLPPSPSLPSLPSEPEKMKTDTISNTVQMIQAYKSASELYKSSQELASDTPSRFFDLVIVKMIYPIFTLLLGYLFGANQAGVKELDEGNGNNVSS